MKEAFIGDKAFVSAPDCRYLMADYSTPIADTDGMEVDGLGDRIMQPPLAQVSQLQHGSYINDVLPHCAAKAHSLKPEVRRGVKHIVS